MKILIGSNGGLTGVYLAKQLKKKKNFEVFGVDSSEYCVGKFFVDEQLYLPPVMDDSYVDSLIMLLNERKIDFYIPTHSKEIRKVSQHEKLIRESTDTGFIVTPYETFLDLESKVTANKNLSLIGIPVPEIITTYDGKYPIILKKNIGSGGSGIIEIENETIHRAYAESYKDAEFYQIIKGNEYTLDCMYDTQGELIGFNQRRRVKTIGGAVSITQNSVEFDIAPWIYKISKRWKFCGCVNFQYIVKDNIPYFIDINLRYPSGGLPLSVESGLDIPQLTLDLLMNKSVTKFNVEKKNSRMTMYRYFEEKFE